MLILILVGGDIGQTLEIDDVILHPNYEQKAYSDIAVLKLKPNKSKSTFYTFSNNCLKFYSEYTKCFLECLKSHKYYESIQNSIMLPKIFKLRVFGVLLRNKGFGKTFCYILIYVSNFNQIILFIQSLYENLFLLYCVETRMKIGV